MVTQTYRCHFCTNYFEFEGRPFHTTITLPDRSLESVPVCGPCVGPIRLNIRTLASEWMGKPTS